MFQGNLSDLRPSSLALDPPECLYSDLDGPPLAHLLPHLSVHPASKVFLRAFLPRYFAS